MDPSMNSANGLPMERLLYEVKKVIVGQDYLLERLVVALLARGHILVEGVPGLAKTLAIKTLAEAIGGEFKRIQFTPDLVPADLVGTRIYNQKTGEFNTAFGPVFTNLLLADEINRAPAKVQSALLEAMEEKQVTIGDTTYPLPKPFMVLATQNPVEQQGTYALPEAQLDRFMLKIKLNYPNHQEEREIMERMAKTNRRTELEPVITPEEILEIRQVVDAIYMDPKIKDYIVDLVVATRQPDQYHLDLAAYIDYGVSPRATINLAMAAKAYAFIQGRGYVVPNDVKAIGPDVLRHRLIVSYEAEANDLGVDDLIARLFDGVEVP